MGLVRKSAGTSLEVRPWTYRRERGGITLWVSKRRVSVERQCYLGRVARVAVEMCFSKPLFYPKGSQINDDDHTYDQGLATIGVFSGPKSPNTRLTFWDPREYWPESSWTDSQVPLGRTQRVLWTEPDEPDKIAYITAYHGLQHEHLVIGFRATCLPGVSRVIGNVIGPAYGHVKFRCNEEIRKIQITDDKLRLIQMTFYCRREFDEKGRTRRLVPFLRAKFAPDEDSPSDYVRRTIVDITTRQALWEGKSDIVWYERSLLQEGVGIWVVEMPNERLSVGVICLKVPKKMRPWSDKPTEEPAGSTHEASWYATLKREIRGKVMNALII
ncbi:hypothetical protein BJY01DRAFT_242281 [Aspergillus pseudoustus]|uniref:Uncharacterized protein n=1 Tax=Aspergillus pseudoustus TaxID=1810923 RepID=A0ABR4L006_9EURO